MEAQSISFESTWTKQRVLPTTDSPVLTPTNRQRAVFSANVLSKYKSICADGIVDTMEPPRSDMALGCDFEEVELPVVRPMKSVAEGVMAKVIHIWEGIVLSVDWARQVMTVKLVDRSGLIVEHSADIDLEWVSPQDHVLLKAGAVFYWTLFKETKRGSISNSQEIRFRKLPSWNKSQLKEMWDEADELLTRFNREVRIAD